MRRLGRAIVIILLCYSGTHAQLLKGYGIKTGVVIANQDFEYGPEAKVGIFGSDTTNRTGFDFGISLEWFNLPIFSLLTEAHYVQKGIIERTPRTSEYGEPMSPLKFDHRIDYLSIPVLAKLSMKTKHISPYLVVGPRVDFLLGYKSKALRILYDELKNTDEGLTIGAGVESNTIPLRMLLEFRYDPDVTYAYKTDLWKIRNHSFEILLGFRL